MALSAPIYPITLTVCHPTLPPPSPTYGSVALARGYNPSEGRRGHRFSAFWLRSKCSICSYRLNLRYESYPGSYEIILFLEPGGRLVLAPPPPRVGPVLHPTAGIGPPISLPSIPSTNSEPDPNFALVNPPSQPTDRLHVSFEWKWCDRIPNHWEACSLFLVFHGTDHNRTRSHQSTSQNRDATTPHFPIPPRPISSWPRRPAS
jgi:hypothetical protein